MATATANSISPSVSKSERDSFEFSRCDSTSSDTISDKKEFREPNWRPSPLTWPFLASLFVVLFIFVGLLEYARHVVPITRTGKGVPESPSFVPNSIIPFAHSTTKITPTVSRRAQLPSVGPRTSSGTEPTPVPSAWSFKNITSLSTNQTTAARNSSEHGTLPMRPGLPVNVLYQNPNQYNDIDNKVGPIVHLAYRCIWEPGPKDALPVFEGDTDMIYTCEYSNTGVRAWFSNDPLDCEVQFFTQEDSPPPYVMYSPHWPFRHGPIGRERSERCALPARCLSVCDPTYGTHDFATITGSGTDQVSTTTLQFVEEATMVSQVPASATVITDISTGLDGILTTAFRTMTAPAFMTTFAFNNTISVTATRNARESVWFEATRTTKNNFMNSPLPTGSGYLPASAAVAGAYGTIPSATESSPRSGITKQAGLKTLMDEFGHPKATIAEYLQTLYNSDGVPTETVFVGYETLTNSWGQPTTTLTEYFPTDPNSQLARPTQHPNQWQQNTTTAPYIGVDAQNYFVAAYLPVLITILLSIFIQMVDKNLKLMLPFHALTRDDGATASDSLCARPGGLTSIFYSMHLLYRFKEPLSLLSDLLVLGAALIVSISSEAIGIKLYGACSIFNIEGCTMYLEVFDGPSRTIEALMIAMAVIVALIYFFLSKVKSGVASNPWSILGTASLVSEEAALLLQGIKGTEQKGRIDPTMIAKSLEGKRFAISHYTRSTGFQEYGIVPHDKASQSQSPTMEISKEYKKPHYCIPSAHLAEYVKPVVILAIVSGLLGLILYYNTNQLDPATNSFEQFMDNQKFGVRFLFAGLGVIITFFWDDMFSRMSMAEPYHYLSIPHRRTKTFISDWPATTVFTGLWTAIQHRNIFAGSISLAGILSKFTPLLLANIPYHVTQTWLAHQVCAWMTVSILIYMILVLVWSFFVKWLHMPVDPRTIAGNMYYLCDSEVLRDFEGTSLMGSKEWKAHMRQVGSNYRFGNMVGVSGKRRIGIAKISGGEGVP